MPAALDTSCCASPNALLPASLDVKGAGGIPEGTVSEVPCHHAYRLPSTFASTQLSWVNRQLGLSVLQGEPDTFPLADDTALADEGELAVNGRFAVGIMVYAQSVVVLLCTCDMSVDINLERMKGRAEESRRR